MKNIPILFCFIISILWCLTSCKNNNDVLPTAHYSYLNVINATPDTLNFYANGTRINNNSNLFPSGASGYYTVTTLGLSSPENYQFKRPATTSVLLNVPLSLDSNYFYSLFVGGLATNQTFSTKDAVYTFSAGNQDTSAVRFVNASPNAGNLDVYINDTLRFSNCAFKSISNFAPAIAGLKTITVCKSGSTTPVFSGQFTLSVSTQYTFFSQGVIGGAGTSAFSLGSMVNQQTPVQ